MFWETLETEDGFAPKQPAKLTLVSAIRMRLGLSSLQTRSLVQVYCLVQVVFSLFSWPLAMYNTIHLKSRSDSVHGGVDFSVITVVPFFVSAVIGLASVRHWEGSRESLERLAKMHAWMQPLAVAIVMVNCIVDAALADSGGYAAFMIVMTLVMFIWFIGTTLIACQWKIERVIPDEEFEHRKLDFL